MTLRWLLAPFLKPAKMAFAPEHCCCGDPQPPHPLLHPNPGPKKVQDFPGNLHLLLPGSHTESRLSQKTLQTAPRKLASLGKNFRDLSGKPLDLYTVVSLTFLREKRTFIMVPTFKNVLKYLYGKE